jgi:hypothetical protein
MARPFKVFTQAIQLIEGVGRGSTDRRVLHHAFDGVANRDNEQLVGGKRGPDVIELGASDHVGHQVAST